MYFDLSIFNNDGITQDERRLKALAPSYIDVDERNILDLMNFMVELSAQFNYYDLSNKPDGNWSGFFSADVHILLIVISKFNISSQITQFSEYENSLYVADDDNELFAALETLFNFLVNTLNTLNLLKIWLQNIPDSDLMIDNQDVLIQNMDDEELRQRKIKTDERFKMVGELRDIVKNLDTDASALQNYLQEAKKEFGIRIKGDVTVLPSNGNTVTGERSGIFSRGGSARERILNGLTHIKEIFNDLGTKYNHLLGVTNFYLKSHDLLEQNYNPGLALCFAFLHLYMHLAEKLNKTTKNHLDLYYKQILGLDLNPATPDSVHVVFEKVPAIPFFQLNAGEELLAQIPGRQEPVVYTINESVLVTAAQIAEVKTLFLADHSQQSDGIRGTIKETQVYCGDYPCMSAANFLKNKSKSTPWPVLGQDQYDLPDDEQTMQTADLGIMLASPLLYMPEGNRNIIFDFYLEDASFELLNGYFENYSKIDKRDLESVNYQLLSSAFVITYTDTKGWVEVKKYIASLNTDARKIEIEIVISNSEQFIDVYKQEIHGGNFDINWPVFKFLINNLSQNNAFTFLRNLQLKRINIKAKITGSQTVKLQNNIGPLSSSNPGQMFGPLPSVGSYLEIKNSNILNSYLRNLCINMEWVDLPREPGGWKSYYSAYNNSTVNNSFKVKISTQTDTKIVPKGPDQQEYNLFETRDDDILKKNTALNNIDIRRLGFNKKPLLDKEGLVPDKNFSEGALRIELAAPDDAFGHKLFPLMFQDAVLHNAKIYFRKWPIPNIPYIPVIRSITIDYELEHSESLVSGNSGGVDTGDLRVFHIYPFGFDEIYPGKKRNPYFIIPDFDQENNLFLGLRDIQTGQVISLLFQLEENNFTDFHNNEQISWSYLDNNAWVYLTPKDILADGTSNFINTGIVSIKLPPGLKCGNTILSPKLYWIRASAPGKTNVNSNVIGVYTQAVMAQGIITNAPGHISIPAGSVKMFKRKIAAIQTITQPFPSFGGKPAETNEQFYIRVSERLRHGQKLLTSRDIEQAILQQFPEIFMVKCINPKKYPQSNLEKVQPHLIIIVVPREQSNGLFISDEPMVNLSVRYKVKMFIEKSIASYLTAEIKNPVYERIKVTCTIRFADGIPDNGMYIQKLNDDIKRYLCPWLYDQASYFKIGSGIHLGEMLNYIKKLPYIKYVTGFSVAHFYFRSLTDDMEKARVKEYTHDSDTFIKGSLPETVLIPSKTHLITVEDNSKNVERRELGIGDFSVRDELLVNLDKTGKFDGRQLSKEHADNHPGNLFDLVIPRNLL